MNKREYIIALDTSNYTTSVALMDSSGELVLNLKKLLPVKEGERGLRQSDAVFHHTVHIPELMKRVRPYIDGGRIVAVGVSEKPRNVCGSYMPCFLVGVSVAESLGAALGAPVYKFSHQCGHIMAALYSSGAHESIPESFAAFHVSGGTTELVSVKPSECGFETELVGGTCDLNAGQVIDRIGVHMGLAFPAGAELERLALTNGKKIPKRKLSASGTSVNLSGLENMAVKLYGDTSDKALVAAFVLDYVGRAILAMSEGYEALHGKTKFVYAGGVMSNSIIKKMLSEHYDAYFAEPALSADNAVGVAALALKKYKSEKL